MKGVPKVSRESEEVVVVPDFRRISGFRRISSEEGHQLSLEIGECTLPGWSGWFLQLLQEASLGGNAVKQQLGYSPVYRK